MALQADLLGAHALGMRTVVCATGNPPLRGDYPNVDGIWEVDSVGLVELLAGLNQGRDSDGLTLATKTSFHIGARFNPGAPDVTAEVARTRAKLRAGAQFLITRPVYELRWVPADGRGTGRRPGPGAAGARAAAQLRRGGVPGPRGARGNDPRGHAARAGAGRRRRGSRRPGPGGRAWPARPDRWPRGWCCPATAISSRWSACARLCNVGRHQPGCRRRPVGRGPYRDGAWGACRRRGRRPGGFQGGRLQARTARRLWQATKRCLRRLCPNRSLMPLPRCTLGK